MGYRVMIVDDSLFSQSEMRKMLEETEMEVVCTCRSGEEAIQLYEGTSPDLVAMDIVLPGIDGLAAAHKILAQWPDAKILMVSSLAYDETAQWATELGAQGALFKPYTREELLQSFRRAVGASTEAGR